MKNLLLVMGFFMLFIFQRDAQAGFGCSLNGVALHAYGGAFNVSMDIPVDATVSKKGEEIMLFNLSPSLTCDGHAKDALRIMPNTATLDPLLVNQGYTGFIIDPAGVKYNFSELSNKCIWPDGHCSDGRGNSAIEVKVGIKRASVTNTRGVSVPVGTTLAKFTVQQHGYYSWGLGWGSNTYIMNFKLKSPFVMPAYTCNVSNPNLTVDLKPVSAQQLRDAGAGRYTEEKPFSFALICEPETAVDIKFEGTTMAGYSDVLKNTNSQTEAVGIQILHKNTPVVYGQTIRTINSASSNESLDFKAHYFYNGGQLNNGSVRSLATVTFDYK